MDLTLGLVALSVFTASVLAGAEPSSESTPFRVGFSISMFSDINVNDAKAAVKVWAQTVARERGIPTDPDAAVFDRREDIAAALRSKTLDAVALTAEEYWVLSRETRFEPTFAALQSGRTNTEYVLLAHRDSGARCLADLRGHSLVCFQSPVTSLARTWLETEMAQQGWGRPEEFFGRVSSATKVSGAILPVFFRQADACLVNRAGLATMSELNPQVGRQTKVLAESPTLAPFVLGIRQDYTPPIKAKIIQALLELHTTPAGQQVLTVFKLERLEPGADACIEKSCELLARHARLCGQAGQTAAPVKELAGDRALEGSGQ